MVSKTKSPWGTGPQPATPKASPRRYSIGVDLGQTFDYTAVAVLEKSIVPPGSALFAPVGESPENRLVEGAEIFDLVYLKRPKRGTPYDVVAERVAELATKLEPKGGFDEVGQLTLSVDGTGVGRGIVDMIRKEFAERSARGEYTPKIDFRPVTITGSSAAPRPPRRHGDYWAVSKRDIVFPTVTLFQQRRLRIAQGLDAKATQALTHELQSYKRSVNIATGHTSFEPWRESDHDDLLFALALALWGWQQGTPRRRVRAVQ
jgi:hypothetical protein